MRGSAHSFVVSTSILLVVTVVLTLAAQPQTFKVIYSFTGGQDGQYPYAGLTIDQAGNLYGTTVDGGARGWGTVFKLSHKGATWLLSPLYSFAGGSDGANPYARAVVGPDGRLYGTTNAQGNAGCFQGSGCGTVFNLRPPPRACTTALCPWTETVLYRFTGGGDGGNPAGADLAFDGSGHVYGTTLYGGLQACPGPMSCGVVYALTPESGGWTESVLYSFTGGSDGGNPGGGLIFNQAGSLYGVTSQFGPTGQGTVYQLTHPGA